MNRARDVVLAAHGRIEEQGQILDRLGTKTGWGTRDGLFSLETAV